MLLCSQAMAMIQRFLNGVHNRKDCGNNKTGYAAISAAQQYADLHNVDNYFLGSGPPSVRHLRKRSVSSQDTVTYLIFRLIELFPLSSMYILLFSKEIPPYTTFGSMISGISSKDRAFILVSAMDDGYLITLYCFGCESECFIESHIELIDFLKTIVSVRQSTLLVYPTLTFDWIRLINSIDGLIWSVPASVSDIRISIHGTGSYSHFVFPWSKSGCCRGYTVGKGRIREGRKMDRQIYESKVNFYNDMISSVPIGQSCPDCMAMERIGRLMQITLPGQKIQKERPKSMPSIRALQEFTDLLNKHVDEF